MMNEVGGWVLEGMMMMTLWNVQRISVQSFLSHVRR